MPVLGCRAGNAKGGRVSLRFGAWLAIPEDEEKAGF